MKSNKGITLVALVITIIVLLILAGVSISLVVGDNGVLTQSKNAATATKKADVEEALGRAISGAQTTFMSKKAQGDTEVNGKTFFDWLDNNKLNAIKENGYTITYQITESTHDGTITKSGDKTSYTFTLAQDGNYGVTITWK